MFLKKREDEVQFCIALSSSYIIELPIGEDSFSHKKDGKTKAAYYKCRN
jgi:hypothetical protein